MFIFWHELIHVTASLFVGCVLFWRYRQRWLIFLSLLVGVFLDIDHIIDYLFFVHFSRLSFAELFDTSYFAAAGKMYIVFHGWEYAIILFISAAIWKRRRPLLLTAAFTMTTHLLIDQVNIWYYSGQWILGYSILWRAFGTFDHHRFLDAL